MEKSNSPKGEEPGGGVIPGPMNPMATLPQTDLYQLTMAGMYQERAVFDLYFRKNPFGGEYTVLLVEKNALGPSPISSSRKMRFLLLGRCYLLPVRGKRVELNLAKYALRGGKDGFYDYLREVDCSDVEVYAIPEGAVVFPKVPLLRVEGPVAVVQLLETPLVNLMNYASLVTTNVARHRFVAGKSKILLEFGLCWAQGPDGGICASKYCYMGGFDATSNVTAGKLFGIPLRGTHSHAFVSSYMSLDKRAEKSLCSSDGSRTCDDFVALVQTWSSKIQWSKSLHSTFGETNQSEVAAFISYALAFHTNFLALVDTYDVMRSGVPNFCAVALALSDLGDEFKESEQELIGAKTAPSVVWHPGGRNSNRGL